MRVGAMNRVRATRRASVLDCGYGVFGVAALGGCRRGEGGLRDLTKLQIPKLQIPKLQIPRKLQAPSTKLEALKRRTLMLDKGSAGAGKPSCPGFL